MFLIVLKEHFLLDLMNWDITTLDWSTWVLLLMMSYLFVTYWGLSLSLSLSLSLYLSIYLSLSLSLYLSISLSLSLSLSLYLSIYLSLSLSLYLSISLSLSLSLYIYIYIPLTHTFVPLLVWNYLFFFKINKHFNDIWSRTIY